MYVTLLQFEKCERQEDELVADEVFIAEKKAAVWVYFASEIAVQGYSASGTAGTLPLLWNDAGKLLQ